MRRVKTRKLMKRAKEQTVGQPFRSLVKDRRGFIVNDKESTRGRYLNLKRGKA